MEGPSGLAALLEVKQRETREVVDVACLFCRETIHGKRKSLFDHFWSAHNFHMGHPDNMVHIDELLALLRDRLHTRFQCLSCDKTFVDYPMLRLHMRKKKHMHIPPNSQQYDRFYLANYVHFTPSALAAQSEEEEDDEDAVARSEAEWTDWDSDAEGSASGALCLFCPALFPTSQRCIEHLRLVHSFDLVAIIDEFKLDFFARIKLINYVRRAVAEKRYAPVKRDDAFWTDVQYLFPYRDDDALLLHDYAPFEANEEEEKRDAIASAAADPPPDGLVELGELLQQGGLE